MRRILAIDYGTKRVGLAVTDPLQLIANGLETVHSKDLISYLNDYFSKEEVETIVIGQAKRWNNDDSEIEKQIVPLIKQLSRKFPEIKIERADERFTSKIAFQTMIDSGLKKKDRQNKELVDKISATLILQSYLERKEKVNK
ncbi:MAG: Holliday junction resolvase RuvX [Flavobacteriales bacterium]|nr:MAG: Holliday junction resolvase RuvX [Flavobacteriales bacterium]